MRLMGRAKVVQEDLVFLAKLLEEGKFRPVIDRSYPVSGIAEAMQYVEVRHAQGKAVITVEQNQA
jgi:NADPH:quinone reductase-like Zn-dependent oxidoreductase